MSNEIQPSQPAGDQPSGQSAGQSAGPQLLNELKQLFLPVLTHPHVFYSEIDLDEPIQRPLMVLGTVLLVNGLASLVMTISHPTTTVTFVLVLAVGTAVLSGLLRMFSRLVGGTGSFSATVRSIAYASAPLLILWMPLVQIFGIGFWLYLVNLAVEKTEGLQSPRSTVVVSLTAACCLLMLVVCMLWGAASMFQKAARPDL